MKDQKVRKNKELKEEMSKEMNEQMTGWGNN